MHELLAPGAGSLGLSIEVGRQLANAIEILKVLIGFSIIIFLHEMGHFLAAKYVGVRVDRFAIGFGYRLAGWRRGEGFTLGRRPNYRPDDLKRLGYGETDYCLKALPFGGYVKMLGQDDIQIDDKSGEVVMTDDPRAFTNRSVGQRMLIVSSGVIMNLVFAALAFMAVFLIGKEMPAPVIGDVMPDSPAERAGLRPGDVVLSINGSKPQSFIDLLIAQVLSDDALALTVERGGQRLEQPLVVKPEWDEVLKLRTIGVVPQTSTQMIAPGEAVEGSPNLLPGDRWISVDGRPVASATEILRAALHSRGGFIDVEAERPDPAHPDGPPLRVRSRQRVLLGLDFDVSDAGGDAAGDTRHLLGLRPRRQISAVERGSAADKAGFRPGDVIARWGDVMHPTHTEIVESIQANVGSPIEVLVERGGQTTKLTVTPPRPFALWGRPRARVGLGFHYAESASPVVADVEPGTPAAELRMPRGSVIRSVAGEAVGNWFELVDRLRAHAGERVTVEFESGAQRASGQMRIPSSIVNELALPADAVIRSIDGQERVRLSASAGDQERVYSLPSWVAVRELLKRNVGRTVRVVYRVHGERLDRTADFAVRPDNVDPWQSRIAYFYDLGRFKPQTETVHAHGNPLLAMWMGAKCTWSKLVEVYLTIKQLAKRNVGVENVAGPVGIISRAVDIAREGFVELLFFLAFLSVNLAVINFLPLPVVDGGLMVFLLIEKIKGRPLSLKTQMVSTVVGLALIVLCFLFVTVQDIVRLFN